MFSISASSLPTIRTYQAAYDFWNTAKIQDSQFRALNPKRKSDTSKRVWSPDEGKTIRLRLHHTDLVEYTESTVSITCYDSWSSCIFIDELAPHEIQARLHRNCMWVNNMQARERALVFNKTERGYEVDPATVMPQYRIEADRKIITQVSKQLKTFLDYRDARAALEGVRLATGVMRMARYSFCALRDHHANPELWPRLYDETRHVAADVMRREMVCFEDGLKKVPLPIGQRPTKSVYDGCSMFL